MNRIIKLILDVFLERSEEGLSISTEGINMIKSFEGLRLEAYRDAVGIPTIGYGHTKTTKMGQTITQEWAGELLRRDIRVFEEGVNTLVRVPLQQCQYDALISFTFNLGTGNLARSTLLKKLNKKDYLGAADEFPRWNRAGGKVLRGLIRRREKEKELFLS